MTKVPLLRRAQQPELTRAVSRVREAGIAEGAARAFARTPKTETAAIARLLREIGAIIEQSPLPDFEWPRLVATLERERLTSLLGISFSSAQRYERGARRTPDDVAARLHFLALLVGDLAGAYNAIAQTFIRSPVTAVTRARTPAWAHERTGADGLSPGALDPPWGVG